MGCVNGRTSWLAVVLAAACGGPSNGTGSVEGRFFVEDCRPSGDFELGAYSYDARQLATKRFENTLQIHILEHAVDLEESDGLTIRIEDVEALRDPAGLPRRLPVTVAKGDANAALSLFDTCPSRPTLTAISGELVLSVFTVSAAPDDTGVDEHVAGTLTATVVSVDWDEPVGTIDARFDFEPEKRSVIEPQ